MPEKPTDKEVAAQAEAAAKLQKKQISDAQAIIRKITSEVKQDWFTIMQLVSQLSITHTEAETMIGMLQIWGMIRMEQKDDNIRFKVVTSKDDRDDIIREGQDMMRADIQKYEYEIKLLEKGITNLDELQKIDMWKGLIVVSQRISPPHLSSSK